MTAHWSCPCCRYLTIEESSPPPGTYLICPVRSWDYDPVQFANPTYRGGANDDSMGEVMRADFLSW